MRRTVAIESSGYGTGARRVTAAPGQGTRYTMPLEHTRAALDDRIARRQLSRLFAGPLLLAVACGIGQAALSAVADLPFFQLKHIRFDSIPTAHRDALQAQLTEMLAHKPSLFKVDTEALQRAIEENPLLADAHVERVWPATLAVSAKLREPAGLVSAGGFYLIDREGKVMNKVEPTDLARYDFPYITGLPTENLQVGEKLFNQDIYRAMDIARLLRERNPQVYALVSDIQLRAGESLEGAALTAHLKGGAEICLGDRNPTQVLPALDVFLQMIRKQNVELADVAYVDLRFENRIYWMDRATFLASKAGVLDDAERIQQEAASRQAKDKKSQVSPDPKTKRLEKVSKGGDKLN